MTCILRLVARLAVSLLPEAARATNSGTLFDLINVCMACFARRFQKRLQKTIKGEIDGTGLSVRLNRL